MPRQISNTDKHITEILAENDKRIKAISTPFNPVVGEGCGDERFLLHLDDYAIVDQYLPMSMKKIPVVQRLAKAGSIEKYLDELYEECDKERAEQGLIPIERNYAFDREQLNDLFFRLRIKHDPFFFFAVLIYIKPKGGGLPFRFVLRRPQRRLLRWLEERRLKGTPIRLILLKAPAVGWIYRYSDVYAVVAVDVAERSQLAHCCTGKGYGRDYTWHVR